ncbi:uncharacterized protein [Nicotiana sylvestris]|uniref:uncharacterized protein n=1 Tax=Nicotiana sylvestris TaxID=4096 RepID=UPI00388C57AE
MVILNPALKEPHFVSCFIGGRKPDILPLVQFARPRTLLAAYKCAKLHERAFNVFYKQMDKQWSAKSYHRNSQSSYKPILPKPTLPKNPPIVNTRNPNSKNMTLEMLKERNLCYKCHDTYFPGHVCKNKTLNVMEAEEFVDAVDGLEEQEGGVVVEQGQEQAEVTLNAIMGRSKAPSTIRITGWVKGQKEIRMENARQEIHLDIGLLKVGGCDIVLGMDWVDNVAPIVLHTKPLSVSFIYESEIITLRGCPDDGKVSKVDTKVISKLLGKGQCNFVAQMFLMNLTENDQKDAIEEIVAEMLKAQTVARSISPFASPVLLVKKKDSSWRIGSMAEHMKHLQMVFELLKANQLLIKKSKCSFGQDKMEYLGHVISKHGMSIDESKIKAMLDWTQPKSVKELREFLGLRGYYRRFIGNFATISKPLTSLLKKENFSWSMEATQAFEELKQAMVQGPVLALPNFAIPFIMEVDASGKGIEAVLMQNGRPIAFISQALSSRHMRLSTYEKELIALLYVVDKW